MKFQGLFFLFSLSSVLAWNVDRRCLQEGQVLAGEEVEQMLEDGEVYEDFELEDGAFDWDAFPLLDALDMDEEPTHLRGSNQLFQNQTARYANSTRNLQSGRQFNLKLTWNKGACWQDEWQERKWCMQCRGSCNSGETLVLKKCSRKSTQRFQWKNGQIKTASKNMCLTRSSGLRLRPCGRSGQKFRGYKSSGGFQLKPSGSSQCLSQHHHPKSGEVIELENCNLAAKHNTDKWNVYWG